MDENLAPLTSSTGPYQRGVIESILQAAAIPHLIRDSSPPVQLIGQDAPLVAQFFLVPESRLQEAKDILCANGVVCDVSERLLRRALDEIVKPLLSGGGDRDLSRLAYILEVNNKETVKAMLEETLRLEGGQDLLEEAFFFLLGEESLSALRLLARVLGFHVKPEFNERLLQILQCGIPRKQVNMLEVIREFPDDRIRKQVLLLGFGSEDRDVREAAEETLFSLGWRLQDLTEGGS